MPVSYVDSSLSEHLSVIGTKHRYQLKLDTDAIIVTSAMCALKSSGPQKLEDFMISSNLATSLGIKLESLVCTHPIGTHATSLAGTAYGGLDARPSQRWMLELCHIIRDGVLPITPTNGESFQLGVNAISDLAMKSMALRDATRWISTAPAEAHLAA